MAEPSGPQRWVVLGASGFVGRQVAEAARAAGHLVEEVAGPRLSSYAVDVDEVVSDAVGRVTERDALAVTFQGVDVVVNAAGLATPDTVSSPALTGANAVLPLVVADAAERAGVRRYVHLSSAAVQGARDRLDETLATAPFSPYSASKALAEGALAASTAAGRGSRAGVVIVRATSVQGAGRPTTMRLKSLSRSPFASVAAPGDAPSPVTSVQALAEFVVEVGDHPGPLPLVVLQPWEGMTVSSVLEAAGGRRPRRLPRAFCRIVIRAGNLVTKAAGGRGTGTVRRVELMWFGQDQVPGWASDAGVDVTRRVADVLSEATR